MMVIDTLRHEVLIVDIDYVFHELLLLFGRLPIVASAAVLIHDDFTVVI